MVDDVSNRVECLIPLVAGGAGGTAGAIFTCPLEVVKTRLQSSHSGFPPGSSCIFEVPAGLHGKTRGMRPTIRDVATEIHSGQTNLLSAASTDNTFKKKIYLERLKNHHHFGRKTRGTLGGRSSWEMGLRCVASSSNNFHPPPERAGTSVFQCLRFIYLTEGTFGLFRGLGPNLMGVTPSRAIYFWAYTNAKDHINGILPSANRDTPFVHILSAMTAGFSASTTTNPIWVIKTRLQLDTATKTERTLNIRRCIRQIFNERGLLGFWRGVTASYWGVSETVVHFVIYEALKKRLTEYQLKKNDEDKTIMDFVGFMACGACSKTCATCIAYPHEVARTRLRERGERYRSFWQTLGVVYAEEGRRGLYRGLCTQLIRQIPNTAIMMSVYELTVYLLTRWLKNSSASSLRHSTTSLTATKQELFNASTSSEDVVVHNSPSVNPSSHGLSQRTR